MMKQARLVIMVAALLAVVGASVWLSVDEQSSPDNTATTKQVKQKKESSDTSKKPGDEQKNTENAKQQEDKPDSDQSTSKNEVKPDKEKVDNHDAAKDGEQANKDQGSSAEKSEDKPKEAGQKEGDQDKADKDKDTKDSKDPQSDKKEESDKDEVPMENVNLKDMEFKKLIAQIAEWENCSIIPHKDVLNERISIFSPKPLPRPKALELIYAALKEKGFVAEYAEGVIYFKPISDAKFGKVPTLAPDEPLAELANRNMIVQKFFKVKNLQASDLERVLKPIIPEHGHMSIDDKTSTIAVIDTVNDLMRIERIIEQVDIPETDNIVTKSISIKQGDPSEIAQLLRIMISDGNLSGSSRYNRYSSNRNSSTSVRTSDGETVILIPEPNRNWIIAKAPADIMDQIVEWVEKLDKKIDTPKEHSLKHVEYVSPREVADQLSRMIERMPGQEIRSSVLVQPLEQARQIMVVGSKENREMILKLIDEIDIPTQKYETQVFKLKYADPDTIKQFIEGLYTDTNNSNRYYYSYRYGNQDQDEVKVISYPTLKQVTVIASKEKLKKIADQVQEWDKPINTEDVEPRIIELQNSDPKKMAALLSKLFTDDESGSLPYWYYDEYGMDKQKIIGPLFGQLVFEPVEDCKKLIVISKIPEAYEVVEKLIDKIDAKKPAEVPMVVTLQYADCEDLCEQLNAIFNVAGTQASVRRRDRGLSEYNTDSDSGNSGIETNGQNNQGNNQANSITGPWSAGRTDQDSMPISNLIGKIRFIPVFRSKAILVLSPEEYQDKIREVIQDLDQPVKQVMIKVVIIEVNQEELVDLGMRFASSPAALGSGGVNSVTANTDFDVMKQVMTAFSSGDRDTNRSWELSSGFNLTAMLDLLVTEASGKILNQPTIWTKDNEEAAFFNGQEVPFIENAVGSDEGTNTKQNYAYKSVGVNLQVRPSVTPENKVDTTIDLTISQINPQQINGNIATNRFNTYTHSIVEDGQTIMISGITLQKLTKAKSKVPLLGDVPLLGALFTHYEDVATDNQLLAFVTPFVFDGENTTDKAKNELDVNLKKMNETKDALDELLHKAEPETK